MPHDALPALARVRRLAQDEALAALTRALDAEAAADAAAKRAEQEIAAETVAAAALEGGDSVVEAFAAWLPGARHRAAQARAACERAGAETARARAVLAMARAAAEAITTLIAERAAHRSAAEAARAQLDLEDAARNRPAPGQDAPA